jgi:hypothetical protein
MIRPGEVREGMTVRAPNGQVLGRVGAVGDHSFLVERGLNPEERYALYQDAVVYSGDVVVPLECLWLERPNVGGATPPKGAEQTLSHEPLQPSE